MKDPRTKMGVDLAVGSGKSPALPTCVLKTSEDYRMGILKWTRLQNNETKFCFVQVKSWTSRRHL